MEFENNNKAINQPDITDIHRTLHPTKAVLIDFPNAYEGPERTIDRAIEYALKYFKGLP